MIRFLKTYLFPLILAAAATAILATIMQTQRVISALKDAGGTVSGSERISMTLYDAQHLGSLYFVFIFIALLVALTVAAFIARRKAGIAKYIYMGAGFVAMFVMLFLMKKAFFDVHIIAGARDGLGLILQGLAGAIGGYVFWRLRRPGLTDNL